MKYFFCTNCENAALKEYQEKVKNVIEKHKDCIMDCDVKDGKDSFCISNIKDELGL